MLWVSELWVGRRVHGVVVANSPLGLVVAFQRNSGLLVHADLRPDDNFEVLDEIDGYIKRLDPVTGEIWLSRSLPPQSAPTVRMLPRPQRKVGRDYVEGRGVPFYELYMRRRSRKSW